MAPTRVILMSCGSYNPPTNMHLRMFEIARDHLHRMGTHIVVGGLISPVHDAYAKKELASATHRCSMLRLALQNSDWIKLSSWETRQNGWTKTRISLQHHQNLLNSVLLDSNNVKHHVDMEDLEWIPENVKNSSDNSPIQIKLLCGGDLLESFGTCDLWAEEDIDAIVGEHGLVVITREGSSPNKFIYDSDILSKHMHNIYIVTEWIPNEVSSSRIRRALKRGESVRYLLQDSVIDYIYKHGIYDAKPTTAIIKLELTSPNANNYLTIDSKYQNTFLTPSPSDVTMESPSPIEIISIDVPDTVLRKNMQNATSVSCVTARHSGLEDAREKFINALVAENGNAKHLVAAKAAYPGLAKQIIATETGESQILGEVGFADDDKKVRRVVKVQPRPTQVEQEPLASSGTAKSSKVEENTGNTSNSTDEPIKETVRLEENRDESTIKEDILCARLVACKDAENKSSISSPSLSTNSAVDNSGRHECALSDFSVDKEDYRLTRYGLDQDAEDEPQGPSHEFDSKDLHSYSDDLPQDSQTNNMPKIQDTVTEDRIDNESDNALDQDNFSDDSIRCSNTQVLVLVSAMIHNNVEQETTATVIVEENDTCSTGEITIYKGDPETSTEKLSFTIQSPVPTTISEESTVTIQEITDDIAESTNQGADAVVGETRSARRDVNLEIDGKYLKSVVNSRKSPRKSKSEQMRLYGNEEDTTEEPKKTHSRSDDVFHKSARSSKSKSPKKEPRSSRSYPRCVYDARSSQFTSVSDDRMRRVRQYDAPLKGSLDSVVATNDPREMPGRKARASEKAFSKKSKSYESIKKIQEVYLEESSKTDSTSKLITANDYDLQTDEYCSVCCYANEMSLRTEETLGSPTQETFYTLRSNCSSFADEDSTECDICSSWNLQESTDTLDRKILASEGDPFCEVCEICGEVSTTYDTSQDSILPMTRDANFGDASSYRIPDNAMTDPSLEDDSFEIENCGFQSGGKSMEDRGIFSAATEPIKKNEKPLSVANVTSDAPVFKETLRERYFVPKDEVAILTSGARRIGRKGSLLRRTTEESGSASHDKRRYSSVDNLQGSKVTTKVSERPLRSKHSKLIGSADNIRSSRSSRRCKSLQRSADNVRYLDSSTDNLDSLAEGFAKEEDKPRAIEWIGKPKIRDNETVKMILTKHGIKIISEKETAL